MAKVIGQCWPTGCVQIKICRCDKMKKTGYGTQVKVGVAFVIALFGVLAWASGDDFWKKSPLGSQLAAQVLVVGLSVIFVAFIVWNNTRKSRKAKKDRLMELSLARGKIMKQRAPENHARMVELANRNETDAQYRATDRALLSGGGRDKHEFFDHKYGGGYSPTTSKLR